MAVMWDVWQHPGPGEHLEVSWPPWYPAWEPATRHEASGELGAEFSQTILTPPSYSLIHLVKTFLIFISHFLSVKKKMNFFYWLLYSVGKRVWKLLFDLIKKHLLCRANCSVNFFLRVTIRPWPRETLESLRWRVNSTKVILFSLQHSCNVNNKTVKISYHFVL